MNFIYSNSSVTSSEAAYAYFGIFIPKKLCTPNTYQIAFNEELGSQAPSGDILTIALDNLSRAGILNDNFNSASEQKRLEKAFRRVIVVFLYNNSYFGFSDTVNILHSLTGSPQTPDYSGFFTEPHLAHLAAFSSSIPNVLSIGYSRLIRSHLTADRRNEILDEVYNTFSMFEPSSTSSETLMSSFMRFKNDLLAKSNFFSVYGE